MTIGKAEINFFEKNSFSAETFWHAPFEKISKKDIDFNLIDASGGLPKLQFLCVFRILEHRVVCALRRKFF